MMAGLEVVVRPVVFPDIRPAPARPVAPADDPTKGIAVIEGSGGQFIDLSFSESSSWSKSKTQEVKRTVDVERIYQKTKNPETGKEEIEKENYVDVERMTQITEEDGRGVRTRRFFAKPNPDDPKRDNIEILEKDIEKINKDLYKNAPKVDDDREPNVG
jgi:hypothetical protein